jgi:1-acyl-sn-glycerol-3-phosphate acyltransferase
LAVPLRAVLAVPAIGLLTVGFGAVATVAGLFDRGGRSVQVLTGRWATCLLRVLGVAVEVEGSPRPDGPALYAVNHGSALDIPILLAHLSPDLRIIHKRSLYLVPVLGWCLWLGGHIGIDRRNPFRARRTLADTARRMGAGTSVLAFPEGTRSPDAAVRRFKRGSFVLATDAGVPVVPVSLVGVKSVVPRGLGTLRPGRVRVKIHPALATRGRPADSAAELAEEVRRIVAKGCAEAS